MAEVTTIAQPQDMTAILARMAALEAENAKLRASKQGKVSLKVTEKGGVALYGVGRFPVSLYRSQWEVVLKHAADIEAFIVANAHLLSTKAEK